MKKFVPIRLNKDNEDLVERYDIEEDTIINSLISSPTFPNSLYENLPKLLSDGCKAFSFPREKDVFLTGSLSILSGCFPNVYGIYNRRKVWANLYSFTVAPASSGKGALIWAKKLCQSYHDHLLKINQLAEEEFVKKMESYNNKEIDEKPEEPPKRLLYIPGNSSSAGILKALTKNNEQGIIVETEADTLSNALGQDWGGFSDLLRKAFHHEPVTMMRKGNSEFIEMNRPSLSIALTGTPGQVRSLINSVEDGLFSRFIYYGFIENPEWRDVSPYSGLPNLDDYFLNISGQVKDVILFYEKEVFEFQLTFSQWNYLNEIFSKWLKEFCSIISIDLQATVKRLGLITFRIALVLTIFRYYETGKVTDPLFCIDVDFITAIELVSIYKFHAINIFNTLPNNQNINANSLQLKFHESLPVEFERYQAIDIGKKIGLSERTTDKYLNQLYEKGFLKKPKYGSYSKS